MKNKPANHDGIMTATLLITVLALLFWRSFDPACVHFSNDGPLGQQNTTWQELPSGFFGLWDDLNDTGFSAGLPCGITVILKWFLGPVGFAKFYAPCALLILGLGMWAWLRALKLSPLSATLGSLAAMLNSANMGDACWGTASHQIAFGMDFFALALICSASPQIPRADRWTRLALAGLCVGINVMEGADIGALCSLVVALFAFFKAITETGRSTTFKIIQGSGHVAVITIFAGFLAAQTVVSLVDTSIQGVAGAGQDTETKAQHWDWATQWSLPKKETLSLVVPGLFGYKMDTPKDMMPPFQKSYEGGVYWGGIGRDPALDRFLDAGGQGTPPSGFMRFSGGGSYCGVLVMLVAVWAVVQSFRREKPQFSPAQRKFIWFWVVLAAVSLPLAWGRFAPGSETSNGFLFYAFLYKLPYFSTIRNPCKFLIFLSWSVVVLFAYGVEGLCQRFNAEMRATLGIAGQLKLFWSRATKFDRCWVYGCAGIFAASLAGCLIYSAEQPALVAYLQRMGFPDEGMARQIAAFSLSQTGWVLGLLLLSLVLVLLIISGYFVGARVRWGKILFGSLLVFDLGRADLPYVVHWDYKQKYEVDSLNPIVSFLRDKPYEHRVAGLPFNPPQGLELLNELYRIEWMQHFFPYYNIQCLDLIQMPRMPVDLKMYLEALSPRGTLESAPLLTRHWELTNTRYLLGPAGYLEVMNQQLDPEQKRFRIVERFEIVPKPGILQPTRLEEMTAALNPEGRYALFEFTGALPRAKLYSNWQVNTNDSAVLNQLADLNFNPAKTVLISTPQKYLPEAATNENSGSVEYASYAPKKIVLNANATVPSVLLLNDKYDPNWRVTVDGQSADLLRCNFLMRGVYLSPGAHTVEFDFSLPHKFLYVTLAAFSVGLLLCVYLFMSRRPAPDTTA
jgi:hypothetical protein